MSQYFTQKTVVSKNYGWRRGQEIALLLQSPQFQAIMKLFSSSAVIKILCDARR